MAAHEQSAAGVDAFEKPDYSREEAPSAWCHAASPRTRNTASQTCPVLAPARAILGETTDAGNGTNPVFCSQFVFDAITHGGRDHGFSAAKFKSGEG